VFVDMVRSRMVDCIVSTGANIVDQDFFEALGFRHYVAEERLKAGLDDAMLRGLHIDRIYDTLIDEDELRICDETVKKLADELPPRPYSSREFIGKMSQYLVENGKVRDSIVLAAYEHDVPIFCPAFSDSSAGLGIVAHLARREAQSLVRQRQRFLRTDADQNPQSHDGDLHDRRRRAQELHAGHRGRGGHPGTRCPDAQVRPADHHRGRARRGAVQFDAERSF
jgi:hypothetical protein